MAVVDAPSDLLPGTGLLSMNYPLSTRRYDELRGADGQVRGHWQPFLDELSGVSAAEYATRLASAHDMMRNNAVTYNVYDDDKDGQARSWQLDILPLVIDAKEWATIEAGVAQRARLADAILADIYGPQKLISEGHLPPHLVAGHPAFLRPLMGITPPSDVRVHLYSADLARAPDGSWVVAALRADAPSGMGYALENRIVVSQTFPDLFRDQRVRRLAFFFQHLRDSVLSLAPVAQPRAVLLTPGPYNEAYFEHAYLAHYLGLALVEGEDLAVRDGQVFLKTLAGLERVDVVFRRVDSHFCDPLELKPDSALGVPGLVEAARNGGVVLANALGGSVVEGPGFAAYMPQLSQALLGEKLKLADIPTLWCGTEAARKEAFATLDKRIVRKAFDSQPLFSRYSSAKLGSDLSAQERANLSDAMTRRGGTYVVQDIMPLGLTPSLGARGLIGQPYTLRVYAAWTPMGYIVMPGGLARIAPEEGPREVTMQSGAQSKDTWVLSDAPVGSLSLLPPSDRPVEIRRAPDEPASRAMDNLFWLGRYAERAENLTRVLRTIVLRLGDNTGLEGASAVAGLARRLLVPLTQTSAAAADAAALGDETKLADELHALISDKDHPHGLQRLLANVRRTAWATRDRLSLDTWRSVHAFTSDAPTGEWDATAARTYLDALVRRAAALSGLSAENMTRGRNWLFADMGRRVERASHTTWLTRQTLGSQDEGESARFQAALEIADSAMTYRYRYLNHFQAAPLIDLLLLDDTNPRSVMFQLNTLASHILPLPRLTPEQMRQLDKAILNVVLRDLRAESATVLAQPDERGRRRALASVLDSVDEALGRFSDAIADAYFQHAKRQRTGGGMRKDLA